MTLPRALVGLSLLLGACSRPRGSANDAGAAWLPDANAGIDAGKTVASSVDAARPEAGAAPDRSRPASFELHAADGGSPGGCRIVRPPAALAMRGAVALDVHDRTVDAILDDDGRPHVEAFLAGPLGSSSNGSEAADPGPTLSGDLRRALGIACASASDFVFCPDRSGAVHRSRLDGSDDRIVASSRSGSRIAATSLAGTHVAMAYLASRQTSEGWVSEAWLAVDDDPPLRISEDGSGATSVAIAPRGSSLLVLTVDSRTALTAMHARTVTRDAAIHLGEDVVAFVGGPGDRRTAAALAVPPTGVAWGLLPISKDVGDFGLAVVKIEDPPRVDEAVAWAMYPNGLDPAPVAAAVGRGTIWVARVRPDTSEPGAKRDLELGEIQDAGVFVARAVLPTTGNATDVTLAMDPAGGLWIAWLDAGGSWVERLACR